MYPGAPKDAAIFGFGYNKANFKFDQKLRWLRYVKGRNFQVRQFTMFREDIVDITSVTFRKLKIYGPLMTLSCTAVFGIICYGRFGIFAPGPPTYIAGPAMYISA